VPKKFKVRSIEFIFYFFYANEFNSKQQHHTRLNKKAGGNLKKKKAFWFMLDTESDNATQSHQEKQPK